MTAPGFYTATGVVPASDRLWIKFIDILDRARNKGLLVDVTLDARTPAAQAAAPMIAQRLAGGYRHVLCDVYNEWDTHISPPNSPSGTERPRGRSTRDNRSISEDRP